MSGAAFGPWTRVSATTRRVAGKRAPKRGDHVAARRGVRPGEQPDSAWESREWSLSLLGEEPFGRQSALQALEGRQLISLACPFDCARAEDELALGLVEVEIAHDLDAISVGEREVELVVSAALHLHLEARIALAAEREEHGGPGFVSPKLAHLALDPDPLDPPEIPAKSPVERRNGIDLAVADHDRLGEAHQVERTSSRLLI